MIRRATLSALLALVVLALVVLAVLVPAASAQARAITPTPVGGRAWTVPVIRLFDSTPSPYREGINIAIRSWNEADIGIRFARTTNRATAHVVIGTALYPGMVEGKATLGMTRGAWVRLDTALVATEPQERNGIYVNLPGGAVPELIAEVTAHELGHVLGLRHTTGCSLMRTTGVGGCSYPRPATGMWACRMQQRKDLLAMARRYGGRGVLRAQTYCRISATSAGAIRALTATASSRSSATALDWRESTNAWGYTLARSAAGGGCPATPDAGVLQRTLDMSKFTDTWDDATPLVAARYCYSVWSRNGRGTLTGPARIFVDVVPPTIAPVSNLQSTLSGSTVQFSWTSPAGTAGVRIYRSNEPGEIACAVPPFAPVAQVFGGASYGAERGVPSGTWTYAVTRTDDPGDTEPNDSPPQWASAPVCTTVTVP